MTTFLSLLAVAALLGGGTVWRLRENRRLRAAQRDDLRRAGASDDLGPEEAALRAEGQAAWMRPGGF